MTLKDFVLKHVPSVTYYAKRFPQWARIPTNVLCCFHKDASPSLSLNLLGGGARCHAATCAKRIGNIVHFEAERTGVAEAIAARRLYTEFIRPLVPSRLVIGSKNGLAENTAYILKIRKELGLSYTSIRRFQIGFDESSRRLTFPVYDEFNQCINIRYYRLPSMRNGSGDTAKIYNHSKGYGRLDLFPANLLHGYGPTVPLYFMASETETMLAIQNGLAAFCTTTGEGNWNPDWNDLVRNRLINLVFDSDAAGQAAEQRISKALASVAKIRLVRLPFKVKRKDWKDFRDFIVRDKRTIRELKIRTVLPPSEKVNANLPEIPKLYDDKLHEVSEIASDHRLLNATIKCHGIVSAKATGTYSVPWKFEIKLKDRPKFPFELKMGRELLRLTRASDGEIEILVRALVGSATAEVKPIAYITATLVEIIPTASVEKDVLYTTQRCFYIGPRIESNVPYEFTMVPVAEIRTQATVGLIVGIKPLASSLDRFVITPESYANLTAFQSSEGGEYSKLVEMANSLATDHTHIHGRMDWHAIAMLSWLSPIGFKFYNETEIQRGWLNSLVVGDTETGKSKVAKSLRSLFNHGNYVNAENCTFVGLVGGAVKSGSGEFMLRWGKIPLGDRQLVILEELSGLHQDEIANMSDVRSSGIARLDKGGISAETNARTRLICLSNARSRDKPLSNYLYGVHAIQELIGHGEDIARFDLITTLIDSEVSVSRINSPNGKITTSDYATDQWRDLCSFVWSLQPDQIHFDRSAYDAALDETKLLSAEYHPFVPIFKGGSGRYKLARLASSIACSQFAYDQTKDRIMVSGNHVSAAARLLRFLYDKPSFGYKAYSQAMFDRDKIKDEKLLAKKFREVIPAEIRGKVAETMIHSTQFTRDELQAIGGISTFGADALIGCMMRERALRKGVANLWEITMAGKRFLEKLI